MKVNPCAYIFAETPPARRATGSQRFDVDTLFQLRHRLSDYLGAIGIDLHRQGSRLLGSCPIHNDRTPSFAVFGRELAQCGCYPCGFIGDVFATSIWLGRATTFPEAVQDVAAVLGANLTDRPAQTQPARQRTPIHAPDVPYALSEADLKKVHAARLAFSDAFWGEHEIIDRIATSLGLDRETLRVAAWGSCGLGLANDWLCYAYPAGLKWRNPDIMAKPRFRWLVGKATMPWRMEWVKPDTRNVYLAEGESDAMAMMAAGIEADGYSVCVASPGTSFPISWAPLFRGKRVVLCFDDDAPGRQATSDVAEMLRGHASEILTWKGAGRHE